MGEVKRRKVAQDAPPKRRPEPEDESSSDAESVADDAPKAEEEAPKTFKELVRCLPYQMKYKKI